jgi:hypothetical protein
MREAQAEPAPIHAKLRVVDSADCGKGGGGATATLPAWPRVGRGWISTKPCKLL